MYKEKYLKYKTKYLLSKNLLGGGIGDEMYRMITTNKWIEKYRNDDEISALAKILTISETVIDDLINIMLDSIRDVSMIKWKVINTDLTKDKLKNIIFVAYHYALENKLSENDAKLCDKLIANSILWY